MRRRLRGSGAPSRECQAVPQDRRPERVSDRGPVMSRLGAPQRSSIIAILLGLAVWCAPASAAGDEQWGWFLAASQIDKWFVLQGEATVTVTQGRFTAELYDHAGARVATLEGTERKGVVEVRLERHATDDIIRHLRGERRTMEFREEQRKRESILLSEPGQLPAVVIGLTRDTPVR